MRRLSSFCIALSMPAFASIAGGDTVVWRVAEAERWKTCTGTKVTRHKLATTYFSGVP